MKTVAIKNAPRMLLMARNDQSILMQVLYVRRDWAATSALLLVLLLIGGCTATGPKFVAPETHAEKATIYLYRTEKTLGAATSHFVYTDTEFVTKVGPGGYFPFVTDAGQVNFYTDYQMHALAPGMMIIGRLLSDLGEERTLALTLDAKASQTYYVRVRPWGKFTLVPAAEALDDIEGLRQFEAEAP